ncbi:SDR family oxidoreductase [uncultured Citricoccus sp.]|uniref:SDR family oxidoreductase n=1 Tax=uncultured Citricoccus sp. TaxID=614031 RepID=UPI002636D3CA|nr:SDR family oxidoreductase [uncultured Citricoccus sp.]
MGAAQAELFVAEGAQVVIADILDDEGHQLADKLGDAACYIHLDVSSEEQWNAAVQFALDAFGTIDILVNNADVYHRPPSRN